MEAFKLNKENNGFIQSLKFQGLGFGFEDGGLILKDLNFEFPMNEIVTIQGNRGEGKTCILKLLAALYQPREGQYLINDQPIGDMSFEEFLPYRLNMGYGFDFGGLISNQSIYDNLMLPLSYHNPMHLNPAEQVEKYLEIFGLQDVRHDRPAMVSGGMRKEACVARAFVMEPELLLLDDPTTGMSTTNKQYFIQVLLDRMQRGNLKHVFIVTEDPILIEGLATKLLFIGNKRIKVLV